MSEKFDALCKKPNTGAGGPSKRQIQAQKILKRIYEGQGAKIIKDKCDDIVNGKEDAPNYEATFDLDKDMVQVKSLDTKRKESVGDFARKRLRESTCERENDE